MKVIFITFYLKIFETQFNVWKSLKIHIKMDLNLYNL